MRTARPGRDGAVDYATLAELRYHIRRFLRAREVAARAAGVEPQQYLLLLQIKGLQGRQPATVGELADRLQLRHHTVVELVDRLEETGMVTRRRARVDRRQVVVALRPAGETVLKKLARYSIEELRTEGPALLAALTGLIGGAARRRPREPRGETSTSIGTSRTTRPMASRPSLGPGSRRTRAPSPSMTRTALGSGLPSGPPG